MSDHTIVIIWVMKIFLYSPSVFSCHLFLILSASVRSILFLSFIEPIFAWNLILVFLIFLEEISSLSHSVVSPYFFALIAEEGFLFYLFIYLFFYCSGICHTLKWISHGFTCVPHPDPPSHLSLHPILLGLPSARGPSTCLMHPTWAGDLFHPR